MACPYRKTVESTFRNGNKYHCNKYTKKYDNEIIDTIHNNKYCSNNDATNCKKCPCCR